MEPGEFEPQFETQDEPQFDEPMVQEDDVDMALPEQHAAQKKGRMQLLGDKRLLVGAALLFGLILGVGYAYLINPVVWVDMGVQHLRADLQEDYVRMVIDAYSANENQDLATRRLNELGMESAAEMLTIIASNPGSQDMAKIQQLSALLGVDAGGGQIVDPAEGQSPSEGEGIAVPSGGNVTSTMLLACTLLVVLVVVVAGVLYFRKKTRSGDPTAIMQAVEITRQAPQTDYVAMGESQPISQWMTTYMVGDDLFDDSFSIDTPAGEFMGECGVGIADTIGVGEPKRVSAFEIWLFDKNDIQTVTKVLMSEHAFSDDAIRDRLSAKGDPEMALTGHEVILETETLQMVARVVDMSYGSGALPDNSFFERATIELAIWQK